MEFFACIETHMFVTAPRLASVATVRTATASVATMGTATASVVNVGAATDAQRRIYGRLLTG